MLSCMEGLIGHKHIVQFFEQVIANGRLHHAYCFAGPEHLGKRTMAEHIAAHILKTKREKLHTHMDFFRVEQELNDKTGKTKKHIDIDQIRSLREALRRRAAMGGCKVALIDGAEKMNTSASNALLKTLEEPGENTILFLITPHREALLETIRSRAHTIEFQPVPDEELTPLGNIEAYLPYVCGRPGLIQRWQEDPDAFASYTAEWQRGESLIDEPYYKKLESIEPLFGDKTDHIQTREALIDALDIWQRAFRKRLLETHASNMVQTIDKIEETKQLLAQNIHPRLAVEQILLTLA